MSPPRVPPFPPLPGAPADEQERYRERMKRYLERRASDARGHKMFGWSLLLASGGVFAVIVYGSVEAHRHGHEWNEQRRQERLAENRAAVASCLDRGGYVVEYSNGFIKECRGAQRAP